MFNFACVVAVDRKQHRKTKWKRGQATAATAKTKSRLRSFFWQGMQLTNPGRLTAPQKPMRNFHGVGSSWLLHLMVAIFDEGDVSPVCSDMRKYPWSSGNAVAIPFVAESQRCLPARTLIDGGAVCRFHFNQVSTGTQPAIRSIPAWKLSSIFKKTFSFIDINVHKPRLLFSRSNTEIILRARSKVREYEAVIHRGERYGGLGPSRVECGDTHTRGGIERPASQNIASAPYATH